MKTTISFQIILFLCVYCFSANSEQKTGCQENEIQSIDFSLDDLSGVWYKVAKKFKEGSEKIAYVLKLDPNGDELKLTEYFEKESGECGGPMTGSWKKTDDGRLDVVITHSEQSWEATLKVVAHHKHAHLPSNEVLGVYWCKAVAADGTCPGDSQVAAILSRSRQPSNAAIFKVVRKLEKACVNPVDFIDLKTETKCGAEILSENEQSQQMTSSESSSDEEGDNAESGESSSEDNCKKVNFASQFLPNTPEELQALVAEWYQIAVIDDYFTQNNIIYFRINNAGEKIEGQPGKCKAKYIMQRHGICYEGETNEWLDTEDPSIWIVELKVMMGGQAVTKQVKFRSLMRFGDAFVTYFCDESNEDGSCKKERIGVWSKSKHISQDLTQKIYKKLTDICVDPTKLHYLNTHANCDQTIDAAAHEHGTHSSMDDDEKCKVENIKGARHFDLKKLEGVWYTAAAVSFTETEMEGKTLESVTLQRTATDDPNVLDSTFYAKFKDGDCVGPQTATVKLLDQETATVEMTVKLPNGDEKKSTPKVLYAGSQHIVYYECLETSDDGKCLRKKLRFDSRTRSVTHNDVMHMFMIMDKACVPRPSIEWLNPHSHCGMELDEPFKQRHSYLALSHGDVMDIILKHSGKNCKVADIRGTKLSMQEFPRSSPWYGIAFVDKQSYEQYKLRGFYSKFEMVAPNTLVGREWIAMGSELGTDCTEIDTLMTVVTNPDTNEQYFKATFDMLGYTKNTDFRIVWTNNKLSVGYHCKQAAEDGTCPKDQTTAYIMSRSESIDHTELMLMEKILKSICVDTKDLKFMNPHEHCLHHAAMQPKDMYPVKSGCDLNQLVGSQEPPSAGVYHMQKILEKSDQLDRTSSVYKIEHVDENSLKVTLKATSGDNCLDMELEVNRVDGSETNEWATDLLWNDTPVKMSMWFGPKIGVSWILTGCLTPEGTPKCSRETGFVELVTPSRAVDPVQMSQASKWLADNCIDPKMMIDTDSRTSCGAELDERTCDVTDASNFQEVQPATGEVYYLTMSTNSRYASMKCRVTDVNMDDSVITTQCYASIGGKCQGPGEGTWTTEDGASWVDYKFEQYTVQMQMMYQDDDHILLYQCSTLNEDKSCMAKRTNLMLYSKQKTIDEDSIPAAISAKIKQICIEKENLQYMKDTGCGDE